jgi:hypothetical protein
VQKLRTDVEEGFQFRFDLPTFKNDTWVNWRVREGDERAEEFEIGLCNQIRPYGEWLRLDTQFMWAHAGGQISTSPVVDQSLVYLAGLSIGTARPLGLVWCEELRLAGYYLYSRDEPDLQPLGEGFANEFTLTADLRLARRLILHAFGGRYVNDDFASRRGDPLYFLDRYKQLGCNFLFRLPEGGLNLEAGFVKQWTDGVGNLTYQLTLTWGQAFATKWLR